jgi:hypothetical protein
MSPPPDLPDTVAATPDAELDNILASHPWLENLEPFSIDWELIWLM